MGRISEEGLRNIRRAQLGNTHYKKVSEEGRQAISDAQRGKTLSEAHKLAISRAQSNKSEAHRRAISEANLGNTHRVGKALSLEHIQTIREANFGNEHTLGRVFSEEECRRMSQRLADEGHPRGFLGKHFSEESRRQISTSLKTFWETLPFEEMDEHVRKIARAVHRRPTEPEQVVLEWLEANQPGKWAYNGDGRRDVIVGGKIPDVISTNGLKEVIEIFGEYWHSEDEVEPLIEHYAEYGFKCHIFWDYEVYSDGLLQERLG